MIDLLPEKPALCIWSQFKVVSIVPMAVFCLPFPGHREAGVGGRGSSDAGKGRPEAGHTSGEVTGTGSGLPPAPKDKGGVCRDTGHSRLNR